MVYKSEFFTMKRIRQLKIAILILFLLFYSAPYLRAQQFVVDDARFPRYLPGILKELGERFHCYFTIEIGWNEVDCPENWYEFKELKGNCIKETLIDSLNEIKKYLPDFTYEFNSTNPQIIHLIDIRLHNKEKYILENRIGDFKFEGTIPQMVEEIRKRNVPIEYQMTTFIRHNNIELGDWSSSVKIKGKNLSVRHILSNGIDLTNYSRIMWIASIRLTANSKTRLVRIFFNGTLKQTLPKVIKVSPTTKIKKEK
ncbi:MAG: hypothetical protein HY774_03120 [Acidobacteria bacterium]|nr:hypothetical protein [Acidobacteriota bacterium]